MSRPPPLCRVRAGRSSSRIKQSIPRRVGWRGALCRHTGLRRRTFTPYEQSISRRVGWRGALCRNTGLRRRTSTPYKRSIPRLVGWLGALCRHTGPRRRTMTPYKLRRPGQSWRLRSLGSRHWRFVRQSRNLGRRSRLNRRTGCFTRCFLKTLGRRGPTPLRHDGRVEGTKWVLGQTAPHHAILSTAIHRRRENAIFSNSPSMTARRSPVRPARIVLRTRLMKEASPWFDLLPLFLFCCFPEIDDAPRMHRLAAF